MNEFRSRRAAGGGVCGNAKDVPCSVGIRALRSVYGVGGCAWRGANWVNSVNWHQPSLTVQYVTQKSYAQSERRPRPHMADATTTATTSTATAGLPASKSRHASEQQLALVVEFVNVNASPGRGAKPSASSPYSVALAALVVAFNGAGPSVFSFEQVKSRVATERSKRKGATTTDNTGPPSRARFDRPPTCAVAARVARLLLAFTRVLDSCVLPLRMLAAVVCSSAALRAELIVAVDAALDVVEKLYNDHARSSKKDADAKLEFASAATTALVTDNTDTSPLYHFVRMHVARLIRQLNDDRGAVVVDGVEVTLEGVLRWSPSSWTATPCGDHGFAIADLAAIARDFNSASERVVVVMLHAALLRSPDGAAAFMMYDSSSPAALPYNFETSKGTWIEKASLPALVYIAGFAISSAHGSGDNDATLRAVLQERDAACKRRHNETTALLCRLQVSPELVTPSTTEIQASSLAVYSLSCVLAREKSPGALTRVSGDAFECFFLQLAKHFLALKADDVLLGRVSIFDFASRFVQWSPFALTLVTVDCDIESARRTLTVVARRFVSTLVRENIARRLDGIQVLSTSFRQAGGQT